MNNTQLIENYTFMCKYTKIIENGVYSSGSQLIGYDKF